MQCVFHGIRLLRLMKIGCRETINFFCDYPNTLIKPTLTSPVHIEDTVHTTKYTMSFCHFTLREQILNPNRSLGHMSGDKQITNLGEVYSVRLRACLCGLCPRVHFVTPGYHRDVPSGDKNDMQLLWAYTLSCSRIFNELFWDEACPLGDPETSSGWRWVGSMTETRLKPWTLNLEPLCVATCISSRTKTRIKTLGLNRIKNLTNFKK